MTFDHPTAHSAHRYDITGSVTSKDGTNISHRQFGHGVGVVILHGAASSGYNHIQLAEALADDFTVYVPDRRCHSLGFPFAKEYSIQKEIEDLDALLSKTGAHYVFGVSSGGIICLQAALALPAIYKAAVYEPPFFVSNQAKPPAILERYDREIAQGNIAAALVTGMQGAQMGPPIFNFIPRWLLEPLTNMALKGEAKKDSGGYVPMKALAPRMHYDFQLVVEMNGNLERIKDVGIELLLLGGSKSPAYMKAALNALQNILPHVQRIELPGLDHAASWNTDRGGQPEPVARELGRFFA